MARAVREFLTFLHPQIGLSCDKSMDHVDVRCYTSATEDWRGRSFIMSDPIISIACLRHPLLAYST